MGGIASGTIPEVFTVKDINGNVRTFGMMMWQFQENYASGGISLSLSGATPTLSGQKDVGRYFRSITDVFAQANPQFVSGYLFRPVINPATIGLGVASGISPAVKSGYPTLMLFNTVVSGVSDLEVPDATAVSGATAKLFIIGY